MKKILLPAAAILIAAVSGNAQTLGTPPTVTGIPNAYGGIDPSQSTYTQTTVGGDTVTLALDATPHVSSPLALNPPPVNTLGVGSYGVSTGIGGDLRSFWNYDFAVSSSLDQLSAYNLTLTVLNVFTGQSATYNPAAIGDNHTPAAGTIGNSESLDFTLTNPFFGSINYDPNANATYDITLTASQNGASVASDAIQITAGTGSAPDATSTMGLMSFALAGLGLVSRRFRK
ncbi:MAG TPA: hypothetical protein VH413_00005 [Verrucomicrobiae bacterium]|jgi:hypothetical protein|nr:hypothetical protein [Verrucomicrobiae bacterium]